MKGSWLLRLVVSAAVLIVLLFFIPVRQLIGAVGRVSPALWLTVLLLFLAGHVVLGLKWRLLMNRPDVPPALWLRAHFAGLVANLCLPGISGGDVVRAGWVMSKVERPGEIAAASVADRVIDSFSLLLVAFLGAVWVGQLHGAAGRLIGMMAAAALAGSAAATGLYLFIRRRGGSGLMGKIAGSVTLLLSRPSRLVACLLMGIGVQSLFLTLNAQLGAAAGVRVSLGAWFFAWPLSKLVATLPISFAGLGVREAALVAFLRPFGAASADVMAAGLLWQAALFTSGAVGWLFTQGLADHRASPEPGTANLEPGTANPEPRTENPRTSHREPENPGPRTQNLAP
jgi:uncharacterized membrane protein YbhN (UPF0104 family)